MTKLLDQAIAELSKHPHEVQDALASLIFEELEDEALWQRKFAESQSGLSRLVDEARDEIARGEVSDDDPGSLSG